MTKLRGVSLHRFPVLPLKRQDMPADAPDDVPWDLVEPHDMRAMRNHVQPLLVLMRRGGLSWGELLALLEDRKWSPIAEAEAFASVKAIAKQRGIDI